MAIEGNIIRCDRFDCSQSASFVGQLTDEFLRLRYHVLGWQIFERAGDEYHLCPEHVL